jgi:hypothetical protein
MIEVIHNEFQPLTKQYLSLYVPSGPGVYMLAVQLANGVHQTFYTSETDNLYKSLRSVYRKNESHLPGIVIEYLRKYQCYFTYYVMFNVKDSIDIEELLPETNHSVGKLKVINCN